MSDSNRKERLDPVLMAVLANRFDVIVREMTNTLFRTGRSAILNTAKDFSCCIVTADDQLLTLAEGLQIHVVGAGLQTASMREMHPDFREGDAFLHNDPYLGNTHTADYTILVPVFAGGRHVFTASAKAHQADCGNAQPTTYMAFAQDIYEEGGLVFPCVQVQRDYRNIEDVIRMCRSRIRVPDMWYGDFLAAMGAARIGERRVKELIERYGLEVIEQFVAEWFDYSEKRMVHAIQQLPDGTWFGESRHDPLPGIPDGIPVSVKLTVDAREGLIDVDLTDNPDCVPAGVNLSESCAIAGARIGVLNGLDPTVPRNDGSMRRIRVALRENCVVGRPRRPASCSMATTNVVNRLINATQLAVSAIGDSYGLAEGGSSMGASVGVISGNDWRHGDAPYINQLILGNNGGPAAPNTDGWVTYTVPDGACSVFIDSVEIIEQKYPIQVRSSRLLADSGGAGRFRGGPAGEVIYGPRKNPMNIAWFCEYSEDPPKGTQGGLPGSRSFAQKIDRDGVEIDLPPIGLEELQAGEWMRGVENGGGGYGNPLERDPERVLYDVVEGWVTAEAAKDTYGVIFSEGDYPGSLAVDVQATQALRDQKRSAQPGDGL